MRFGEIFRAFTEKLKELAARLPFRKGKEGPVPPAAPSGGQVFAPGPLSAFAGLLDRGKRVASRSPRLLAAVVILLMAGVLAWAVFVKIERSRGPRGPRLADMSRVEEFFYCPLGFPLTDSGMMEELRRMGALQPVPFDAASEDVRSGDLLQISAKDFDAFIANVDGVPEPVRISVRGWRIPMKWGLHVGEQADVVLRSLGKPAAESADLVVYREKWGSEAVLRFKGEHLASIEWRYPPGFRIVR